MFCKLRARVLLGVQDVTVHPEKLFHLTSFSQSIYCRIGTGTPAGGFVSMLGRFKDQGLDAVFVNTLLNIPKLFKVMDWP